MSHSGVPENALDENEKQKWMVVIEQASGISEVLAQMGAVARSCPPAASGGGVIAWRGLGDVKEGWPDGLASRRRFQSAVAKRIKEEQKERLQRENEFRI